MSIYFRDRTLAQLERYCLPKRVVGVDISRYAFEFCRSRGQRLLSQSSILELPFKNDMFDLVVCKGVIQHLLGNESDNVALREFYRVLESGGCLLIVTHSSQGMRKGAKSGDENFRMYSLDEVRDKVQEAGFHILKLTCGNILMSRIPTIRRYLKCRKDYYHFPGLPHRRLSPHLEWLNTLLYWVMKSEAWFLSKPSIASPFGHTIFCLSRKPGSRYQSNKG